MNTVFLQQAMQHVKNPNILVNMVSQRVRQLGQGHKPLFPTDDRMSFLDIALREIAEGKISFELEDPSVLENIESRRTHRRK